MWSFNNSKPDFQDVDDDLLSELRTYWLLLEIPENINEALKI